MLPLSLIMMMDEKKRKGVLLRKKEGHSSVTNFSRKVRPEFLNLQS